jgi:hypothetical protein
MKAATAVLLAAWVGCLAPVGCGVFTQVLAVPDDFADYRAFRLAATEGTRLARAQAYIARHPRGAWADEVRGAFETEEGAWFEAAKSSRVRARDYVIDLPRGPHVEAARALLELFDAPESDIGMLELLADARRTSARLDVESARRRRVSEVVLEEVAALTDPATRDADLADPPRPLAGMLRGATPCTWGNPPQGVRDDELYFVLPTPQQGTNTSEGRVVHVRLRVALAHGRVIGGTIAGDDLFVRWAEANAVRVLDPTKAADRAAAASDIADLLAGALEARLPAARCRVKQRADELLARSCKGWFVFVRMGRGAGDDDVIRVSVRPGQRP